VAVRKVPEIESADHRDPIADKSNNPRAIIAPPARVYRDWAHLPAGAFSWHVSPDAFPRAAPFRPRSCSTRQRREQPRCGKDVRI